MLGAWSRPWPSLPHGYWESSQGPLGALIPSAFPDSSPFPIPLSVLRPSLFPQYYVFFSAPEWEGNS